MYVSKRRNTENVRSEVAQVIAWDSKIQSKLACGPLTVILCSHVLALLHKLYAHSLPSLLQAKQDELTVSTRMSSYFSSLSKERSSLNTESLTSLNSSLHGRWLYPFALCRDYFIQGKLTFQFT